MERQKKITADGSHTLVVPGLDVTYHSVYGALQESRHVYIQSGLHYLLSQSNPASVNILEVGFGTGLNALLSFLDAEQKSLNVYYQALEPFPLTAAEWMGLNYCALLNCPGSEAVFNEMHRSSCDTALTLSPSFSLYRDLSKVQEFRSPRSFNLLYYDAFAPAVQPELWTREVFKKLFDCMEPGGVLVTYCSKGAVRRAMNEAGFIVGKISGAAGKREIIRAVKR